MAESKEELKSFLIKVRDESEKAGLKLNIQKIKVIASVISVPILGEEGFFYKASLRQKGKVSPELSGGSLPLRPHWLHLGHRYMNKAITRKMNRMKMVCKTNCDLCPKAL